MEEINKSALGNIYMATTNYFVASENVIHIKIEGGNTTFKFKPLLNGHTFYRFKCLVKDEGWYKLGNSNPSPFSKTATRHIQPIIV